MKAPFRRVLPWSLALVVVLAGLGATYLFRDSTIGLMLSRPKPAPSGLLGAPSGPPTRGQVAERLRLAGTFLLSRQEPAGGWLDHPGITGLCLSALLRSPCGYKGTDDFARRATSYLLKIQQADGSFRIPFSVSSQLANYTTSCSLLALSAADAGGFAAQIKRGADFLVSAQRGADGGKDAGGLGYGGGGKADLSNMHAALEALKAAGLDAASPFYKEAAGFVSRCQDSEGNEARAVKASGGFVYRPDLLDLDGDAAAPYGAMSFAGLDSLLLCQVSKDDQRVRDALSWIGKHYATTENPGHGDLGLYYYFATMAKALETAGTPEVVLADGARRDWRADLAAELLGRQRADGSWVNANGKYLEGYAELATAHALSALGAVWRSMGEAAR